MPQNDFLEFYLSQPEPNQTCFIALRDIISSDREDINETRKYGMPCFCYGKKPIVYLWKDKKTNIPYLLWVLGDRLDHPLLEKGTRKKMKVMNIEPEQDIPVNDIRSLLQNSIDLLLCK